MAAHMHGGGGALNGQRQPVIEMLEFGNFVTVADGLAHGGTIARLQRRWRPWADPRPELRSTVGYWPVGWW